MERRELREAVVFQLYVYDLLKHESSLNNEASHMVKEIIQKKDHIDGLIEDALIGYSLARLSYLDRAIIRLATYEMAYTNTAKAIIINEALELTKAYTDIDDKQRKFNNKLLDTIKESLE